MTDRATLICDRSRTTRECVMEMREQGLKYREIAADLGISLSYAKRCGSPGTSYDTALRASREAKRRRTGTCERCGATTRYNGTALGNVRGVSVVCASCQRGPERMRELAGTRGRTAEFLAYLSEPHRFSELRDHFGISSKYAGAFLNRAHKNGWIRRIERGLWVRVEA